MYFSYIPVLTKHSPSSSVTNEDDEAESHAAGVKLAVVLLQSSSSQRWHPCLLFAVSRGNRHFWIRLLSQLPFAPPCVAKTSFSFSLSNVRLADKVQLEGALKVMSPQPS